MHKEATASYHAASMLNSFPCGSGPVDDYHLNQLLVDISGTSGGGALMETE